MKQFFSALLLVMALTATGQKWQNIKGNGNIKTEERQVGSFTAVENNGSFDVEISYGESVTVRVEADENILPVITTVVKENKLKISTEKGGFSFSHRLKVYVSMTKVEGLEVNGSGRIHGDGHFESGSTARLQVNGSGSIGLNGSQAATLETIVRGSGSITLTGEPAAAVHAALYGSGSINAFGMPATEVMAATHGSGSIRVAATGSLTAETNGSGSIYYKGDISDVNLRSKGSGKVVKQS